MFGIENNNKIGFLQKSKNIINKILIKSLILQALILPNNLYAENIISKKNNQELSIPNYISVRLSFYKVYWKGVKESIIQNYYLNDLLVELSNGKYYLFDKKNNIHVFELNLSTGDYDYIMTLENTGLTYLYKKSDNLSNFQKKSNVRFNYNITETNDFVLSTSKVKNFNWVGYISNNNILELINGQKFIDIGLMKRNFVSSQIIDSTEETQSDTDLELIAPDKFILKILIKNGKITHQEFDFDEESNLDVFLDLDGLLPDLLYNNKVYIEIDGVDYYYEGLVLKNNNGEYIINFTKHFIV